MLQAQDIGCKVGDTISLYTDDSEIPYTVCGIYSDITNGGKTAKISADTISQTYDNALSKASLRDMDSPLMWSIIYVTLKDGEDVQGFIADYKTYSDMFDGTVKVTDIARYIEGTYGQTIQRIKMAACTSVFVATLIIFIVILLFVRLKIWQEKKDIILKKALGISPKDIRRSYLKRALPYIASGIIIGIVMGIFLGQMLAGGLLSSLGAGGFRFVINWIFVFILVPFISVVVAYIAVNTATREVKMTKIEI
jgi:putative ABC transport system permease protein